MKKIITTIATALVCLSSYGGTEYGKTVFMDDVSVGSYIAPTNLSFATTTGGTYTNGAVTNYYRMSATNLLGKVPTSTNLIATFTGNTNSGILATNAVAISWDYYSGAKRMILERSTDLGVTWTNWVSILPSLTSYTDTGTNTWTNSAFSGSAIPAPTVPWTVAGTELCACKDQC